MGQAISHGFAAREWQATLHGFAAVPFLIKLSGPMEDNMVSKKSLVFGYGMGFLLGVLLVLSIAALGAFVVINCLNYLFPVLQIPVDFW